MIKYKSEYCDKFGNIRDNNISEAQAKDIKNLKDRIKKENLTCGETDKTGNLTLDTLENMSNKMEKHIKDDKVVNEKEIKTLENRLKRTHGILDRNLETWRKSQTRKNSQK